MAEDGVVLQTERKWTPPIFVFFKDISLVLKMDSLGKEILVIAVPAAMALAADPIASLIDTAFIGRIGAVEIAAVGISIAIFNQVSKVAIFPLVSITTSFVAEEETIGRINNEAVKVKIIEKAPMNKEETKELPQDDVKLENLENGSTLKEEKKDLAPENGVKICPCKHLPRITECNSNTSKIKKQKKNIPSASTALLFGAVLGILETLLLVLLADPFLSLMGVKSDSPMMLPAHKYLTLRALGAPAVLLSLAMQGVFRGFKDTKTPLYATEFVMEGKSSRQFFFTGCEFMILVQGCLDVRLTTLSKLAAVDEAHDTFNDQLLSGSTGIVSLGVNQSVQHGDEACRQSQSLEIKT
uniref:Protein DETOXIFICATION 43-like n=1 Tax=Tanacetum cinerariifolium TaxID=118510 RepID=A0A6L2K785_TANCI|nr:protein DETOXIFICATION 43-like [Tanacetum cinerariifolium]